ncbi:hypothetical protein FKM82_029157 [Ascaphus truei]
MGECSKIADQAETDTNCKAETLLFKCLEQSIKHSLGWGNEIICPKNKSKSLDTAACMQVGARFESCDNPWLGAQFAIPISLPKGILSCSPYRIRSGILSSNKFWKRGANLRYDVVNPSHSGTSDAVAWTYLGKAEINLTGMQAFL